MADDATDPETIVEPDTNDATDAAPKAEGAEKIDGVAAKASGVSAKESTSAGPKAGPTKSAVAKKAPGAGASKPGGPVVKKRIASKRVTPKGGPAKVGSQAGATPGSTAAHAHAPDGQDAGYSARYTPPTAKYADGPSPTWVPVLMFALLGLGCLFIVANYARAFGEPENWRLLVGLGGILGGIITATNYR